MAHTGKEDVHVIAVANLEQRCNNQLEDEACIVAGFNEDHMRVVALATLKLGY